MGIELNIELGTEHIIMFFGSFLIVYWCIWDLSKW